MRVIDPVKQLGAIVPDAVDGAADGPKVQHVLCGRTHLADYRRALSRTLALRLFVELRA